MTGEFTDSRTDAEKYLQAHRPVRRYSSTFLSLLILQGIKLMVHKLAFVNLGDMVNYWKMALVDFCRKS